MLVFQVRKRVLRMPLNLAGYNMAAESTGGFYSGGGDISSTVSVNCAASARHWYRVKLTYRPGCRRVFAYRALNLCKGA